MPECTKCVYESTCPRLSQSRQLGNGDDTTHRLLVTFFGCHAFKEQEENANA